MFAVENSDVNILCLEYKFSSVYFSKHKRNTTKNYTVIHKITNT